MNVLTLEYLLLSGAAAILLWLTPKKARWFFVCVANLAFFALLHYTVKRYAFFVLYLVCVWLAGLLISRYRNQKITLLLGLGAASALVVWKAAGLLDWTLPLMPLGLSFFTFRAVSYLLDLQHGKCPVIRNPAVLFDYLYFFPLIQAGPINRCAEFLKETDQFTFSYTDQKNGCIQAGLGLFQKLVIADYLGPIAQRLLSSGLQGWYLVLGIVLYSFWIYVDFDSYSNIAIGTARLLGYHIPANFHTPYLAGNIQEFWRRWHISLSSWLRDYVYIPLGGSRCSAGRHALNVLLVFLVSGLWHGSTWMYVCWGLGHGLLSVLEGWLRRPFRNRQIGKFWSAQLHVLGVLINFVLVSLLWVFFRSASLAEARQIFRDLFPLSAASLPLDPALLGLTGNEWGWLWILLGIIVVSDLLRNRWNMVEGLARRPFVIRWAFYFLLMVIAIIFGVYGPGYDPQDFIYVTF